MTIRIGPACGATLFTVVLYSSCRQAPTHVNVASPTPATTVAAATPWPTPSVEFDKPYFGQGVITLINREEGWVEIEHGEIRGLMPAMTMEFLVKEKSLLDNAAVGDRVDFTVVETRKAEFITELKKIQTEQ